VRAWRSPGLRVVALGTWPVPWAPSGGRGGVAGPLVNVWWPWGRSRSPGVCVVALGAWPVQWALCGGRGGVADPLRPVWRTWGRGRSPGPRVAVVGAWIFPWDACGGRGGVAGPMGHVWPLWDVVNPLCSVCLLWGRGRFFGTRVAAMGVLPVLGAPYLCRGDVAGSLGPVCPS